MPGPTSEFLLADRAYKVGEERKAHFHRLMLLEFCEREERTLKTILRIILVLIFLLIATIAARYLNYDINVVKI
jgi:hypothetical protein